MAARLHTAGTQPCRTVLRWSVDIEVNAAMNKSLVVGWMLDCILRGTRPPAFCVLGFWASVGFSSRILLKHLF